ncbi:MAG TPA: OsmC family protein [Solirubrobacteraceae bacterium]|nr:OsmC family protein [Solirubrobacteraceae bacterium]
MKASARRSNGTFTHRIEVRGHQLTVDEPAEHGGDDEGPSPQELLAASVASCTAVTMRMYANRKGWDIGQVEVECEYETPERGSATHFHLVLRLPDSCTQEQVDALRRIAGKCPVHRALEQASTFEERVELVSPAQT